MIGGFMIYKDIIINYFLSDGQGVRQAISFDSYREHASSGAFLVKYESRVNDVTAVMHMDIVLVPGCTIF